jgi:hypothetical protein
VTPYVGKLTPDWQVAHCGYSLTPQDVTCLADATWHGITDDFKGMMTCDEHAPIVVAIARWIHTFDTPCGLPDARFQKDLNRCVVPGNWENWEKMSTGVEHATRR